MTKFFQALEDMQFAAPKYKELVDQWSIQIRTGTTTVNIACSIPAEDPTMVVGLIDSDAGYSYFQSRKLFEWYQTYSHRWLSPPAAREEEEKKEIVEAGIRSRRQSEFFTDSQWPARLPGTRLRRPRRNTCL